MPPVDFEGADGMRSSSVPSAASKQARNWSLLTFYEAMKRPHWIFNIAAVIWFGMNFHILTPSAGSATERAEALEQAKYAELVASMDFIFGPFIIEILGLGIL